MLIDSQLFFLLSFQRSFLRSCIEWSTFNIFILNFPIFLTELLLHYFLLFLLSMQRVKHTKIRNFVWLVYSKQWIKYVAIWTGRNPIFYLFHTVQFSVDNWTYNICNLQYLRHLQYISLPRAVFSIFSTQILLLKLSSISLCSISLLKCKNNFEEFGWHIIHNHFCKRWSI